MSIFSYLKITRKTIFNPAAWADFQGLKKQNQDIYAILKRLFTPTSPEREESFEEAMVRLGLTETDVTVIQSRYRIYAGIFFTIGLCTLLYGFYLLFRYKTLVGWILALASAALFWGQAFKYDFWALQMKRKKLGLTFDHWKRAILGEGEK